MDEIADLKVKWLLYIARYVVHINYQIINVKYILVTCMTNG